MRPSHCHLAPSVPTASLLLLTLTGLSAFSGLANSASAQTSVPETKVPRPLPHMEDVKTPPPPPPVKEPAPDDAEPVTSGPTALFAKTAGTIVGQGVLAGFEHRVHFDQAEDGTIWVAGDTYKASFDGGAATYIPFFGSCAPRNFPVSFRIASIHVGGVPIDFDAHAVPVLDGDRVTYDRGPVLEIYDVAIDSIEQSFSFERFDGAGELVVELAVESELERTQDERGLVLRGEHGSVGYGFAVSFDQRDVRAPAPTAWAGDSISLRVPAERTASAVGRLVIDPVVFTFDVDDGVAQNDSLPDVAHDAGTNRFMIVYERVYSATDHDIYSWITNSGGGLLRGDYIDFTTDFWASPKVANNGDAGQFLTVAQVGSPSSTRSIWGRTRNASGSTIMGPQFVISGSESGDKTNPDVGGDPYVPPTYYCVAWQREYASDDFDIHARLVRPNSTLLGSSTIYIDNSAATIDMNPCVSKTDGEAPAGTQEWNIVWSRYAALLDLDLHGAQIHWDGGITTPSFAIDTGTANTYDPSVTSLTDASPRRYLIAYTSTSSGAISAKLMQGTTIVDGANLDSLSGAPTQEHQYAASADCDGTLFVVANLESYNGDVSDYDIYISTYSVIGNDLACAEGHKYMAVSFETEREVEITTTGSSGGAARRVLAVWHQMTSTNNGDIEGARYDADPFTEFCRPGVQGVMACPCGNAPTWPMAGCNNSSNTGGARLAANGDLPSDVVLQAAGTKPTALCIFVQGNSPIVAGTVYGDGVRCAGGTLKRLYTKIASGGVASAPGSGDLSIVARSAALGDSIAAGTKRWYQVYYRDPVSFACGSTATFNITNGIQIDW